MARPRAELHQVPLGHCSSLSRALGTAARPSGLSATPPAALSPAPSSSSLTKTFERIRPSVDPWGSWVVTGFQLDFGLMATTLWASARCSPPRCLLLRQLLREDPTGAVSTAFPTSGGQHPPHAPCLPGRRVTVEAHGVGQGRLPPGKPCGFLLVVFVSFVCLE